MSNLTIIVNELLPQESKMESLTTHPSLAMSEHSLVKGTPQAIRAWLMSCQVDSPASLSALQANEPEPMTNEICGQQHGIVSASLDPVTASLKTFQACLIADISGPSLETWPKAGIVCGGEFYPQPKWERRINEIGSGLWPTPAAQEPGWTIDGQVQVVDKDGNLPTHWNQRWFDKNTGRVVQKGITQVAQMWPTPRSSPNENRQTKPTPSQLAGTHGKSLAAEVGGQLNPMWCEWLMGWPIGWTDLKPLAMDKFQQWLRQHGICLPPEFNVYGDRPLPDWCNE